MDSKDVEKRVTEITTAINDLQQQLAAADQTAWLSFNALRVDTTQYCYDRPNCFIQIGASCI